MYVFIKYVFEFYFQLFVLLGFIIDQDMSLYCDEFERWNLV